MLLCAAQMLQHVNLMNYSERLTNAITNVLKSGKAKTRDLGGYASTTDFTRCVLDNLAY